MGRNYGSRAVLQNKHRHAWWLAGGMASGVGGTHHPEGTLTSHLHLWRGGFLRQCVPPIGLAHFNVIGCELWLKQNPHLKVLCCSHAPSSSFHTWMLWYRQYDASLPLTYFSPCKSHIFIISHVTVYYFLCSFYLDWHTMVKSLWQPWDSNQLPSDHSYSAEPHCGPATI